MTEDRHDVLDPAPSPAAVPTIDDVAAAAGVSPATVSRVINARPVVATETRQRVLAAIERLHFQPNALGRSLATRRTGILGLVIADITNPFYPEIVRGVEQAAAAYAMSVLLYDTAEDGEREAEALRLLGAQHVDGIIICASRLPEARIAALARPDTPLVLINRQPLARSSGTVDVDHEAGVSAAIRHLADLGHRHIAYIGGPPTSQTQQRRLAAFHASCTEAGLTIPPAHVVTALPTIGGGKDAGYRLLGARDAYTRPTAILAYNDLIALGAIITAHEAGMAVPADLSIIGHDDIPMAEMLHPALTTVRQPMRALGEQAVRTLYNHLQKRSRPPYIPDLLRLAPTLIVRDSTAAVPAGSGGPVGIAGDDQGVSGERDATSHMVQVAVEGP